MSSRKRRKFSMNDNTTRYWSGQSNAIMSPMRNTDLQLAVQTEDWSELIEKSKRSLQYSFYNRENNISSPAMRDRYMNYRKKKLKNVA